MVSGAPVRSRACAAHTGFREIPIDGAETWEATVQNSA
jgi:hypothetical protein